MQKKYDYEILILGAGASGLFCASFLKNSSAAIIESNQTAGKKLQISGGGKCNLTNESVSSQNYYGNSDFIESVLKKYDQKKVLEFFKNKGVELAIRSQGQYFCTKSSNEILKVLEKETKNIKKYFDHKIVDVEKKDGVFFVYTDKKVFKSQKLIVATGGLSYKIIGADEIGFKIASKFNHTITPLKPALVGFTVQKEQFWFKNLSGISFKVTIAIDKKEFEDELLFAHKGISGPVVLNASLYWEKGQIKIDFLPNIDLKKLLKNSKKQISSILPIPKRFIKEFLQSIELEDKSVDSLTQEDFKKLAIIKKYEFSPAGNFGYTKAEVTKGGVSTDEIDQNTMQSKKIDGLYFIGEVTNVTGELGGYNLQWAFSSGFVCAKSLAV